MKNLTFGETDFGALCDLPSGGGVRMRVPPSADIKCDDSEEEQQEDQSASNESNDGMSNNLSNNEADEDSEADITQTKKNRILMIESESDSADGDFGSPSVEEELPDAPTPMELEEFEESFVETEYVKVVEGSRIPLPENKGNMCYATSTMHCLFQLKPFQHLIEEKRNTDEPPPGLSQEELVELQKQSQICQLVHEISHDPKNHLTDIIEKMGEMKVGEQADAEEFLQLLLENTGMEKQFATTRTTVLTCTECQKESSHLLTESILEVPLKHNEAKDLQAELGRLKDGITNYICTSRKCSRRKKEGQRTIHHVSCCNSFLFND